MRSVAFIIVFLTLILRGTCVFAVPLGSLISSSHAADLRATGRLIIETQLKNPTPKLLPANAELRQFVTKTRSSLNPGMMVEALYLFNKPTAFHTSVDTWDNVQKNGVFNQMIAISTLTGIQYHSTSRNIARTFYEYSTVVDGTSSRNPLPDPAFTMPPAELTIFARQKDLTFGDNIYRYDCVSTQDAIFFVQENVTSLNYGIIPAIGRGNLRSIIAVIDCGDSILIYAVSMAKAFSVPGMGDRISNSFSNRAEAVLNWLTGRLNNEIFSQ